MSNIQTTDQHVPLTPATLEALVVGGDLSRLNPTQRVEYYTARCVRAGLDPATQPFQYLNLQGKLTLYATKTCTDQLSNMHGIRLSILSQDTVDGTRIVTVRAETRDGRATEEIGALPVAGLKGDMLANALMKCVTKAKRRAVLSVCGLGMMDESEIETVRDAKPAGFATGTVTTMQPPAPQPTPPRVVNVQARVVQEEQAHPASEPPAMPRAITDDTLDVLGLPVPLKVFDTWEQWCKYDVIDKAKRAASKSALKEYTWAEAAKGSPAGKRQASLQWTVDRALQELGDQNKQPTLFATRCAVALYRLRMKAHDYPEMDGHEDSADMGPDLVPF